MLKKATAPIMPTLPKVGRWDGGDSGLVDEGDVQWYGEDLCEGSEGTGRVWRRWGYRRTKKFVDEGEKVLETY